MWICSNHPLGVHRLQGGPAGSEVITVPLDGFAVCTCDSYELNAASLKSQRPYRQPTCRHVAQIFAEHCGFRSDHAQTCVCNKRMIRAEDAIPGWVGQDRNSLLTDLLQMRKDLHDETIG